MASSGAARKWDSGAGSRVVDGPEETRASAGIWRLWIDGEPRPGWANMSIDLALLARAERQGESWLRLYQWAPHCLSFGRHEPALRRYDVDRILELGLDTVRRPSGGRAVWHAAELTYSVAAPLWQFGSPARAYREIHELFCKTFTDWGLDASLAPRRSTPSLDAGSCFASAAGGEVLIQGRKIVGSAQLCRGSALLQHGSILLRDEQELVQSLTRGSDSPSAASSPASPVRNSPMVDATKMSRAVASQAAARWHAVWNLSPDTRPILRQAAAHFARFQSPEWTWLR